VATVRLRLALFILAGFALGGVAALMIFPAARAKLLPVNVRSVGQAMVGGPFTLTDHTGKASPIRTSAARTCSSSSASRSADVCLRRCPEWSQPPSTSSDCKEGGRITPSSISIDHGGTHRRSSQPT
jgi:hypothetical protein